MAGPHLPRMVEAPVLFLWRLIYRNIDTYCMTKKRLRTSMCNDKLSHVAMMSREAGILCQTNFEDLVTEFPKKKHEKFHYFEMPSRPIQADPIILCWDYKLVVGLGQRSKWSQLGYTHVKYIGLCTTRYCNSCILFFWVGWRPQLQEALVQQQTLTSYHV